MAKLQQWKLGTSDIQSLEEQEVDFRRKRERAKNEMDLAAGVPFIESLAGVEGMTFTLLPEAHHTADDIQRASRYLHANRDVVNLYYVLLDEAVPA